MKERFDSEKPMDICEGYGSDEDCRIRKVDLNNTAVCNIINPTLTNENGGFL